MGQQHLAGSNCGHERDLSVGQAVVHQTIVWHASYSCTHCGQQCEEDGRGPAPLYIRQRILEENGRWELVVKTRTDNLARAIKVLRHSLAWSMNDVMAHKKLLPGPVLTGTQAEMEWLARLLGSEGIECSINRLPITS